MTVLDTNVVSELMKGTPDPSVFHWVASQPPTALFTTAVTMAEVFYGLELLPQGRHRRDLTSAAERMFEVVFRARVLPFDTDAASVYGELAASRQKAGRPSAPFDLQVAAIARSRGAAVATRNTADFDLCDLTVIDPWRTQ